eukprot:COSAG02_NODE_5788_length_4033_cov_5.314692_3_plen_235_part_00
MCVLGREWHVTVSSLEHDSACNYKALARACKSRTAYEARVLKYAVFEEVSNNKDVQPANLVAAVAPLLAQEPSAHMLGKLKKMMIMELDDTVVAGIPGSAKDDLHELCYLVQKVWAAGHQITVFTKTPAAMRKLFVQMVKAKHERVKKQHKKKKLPGPGASKSFSSQHPAPKISALRAGSSRRLADGAAEYGLRPRCAASSIVSPYKHFLTAFALQFQWPRRTRSSTRRSSTSP